MDLYQWVQYIRHTRAFAMFSHWSTSDDDFLSFQCVNLEPTTALIFIYWCDFFLNTNMYFAITCIVLTSLYYHHSNVWPTKMFVMKRAYNSKYGCYAVIGTCLNHTITLATSQNMAKNVEKIICKIQNFSSNQYSWINVFKNPLVLVQTQTQIL